ncbi:Phosphoribosylformimino-5-aminoimidazole carboxamide ribotide isomerase [Neoconidiobolus thromboides FSU 785]|nr:Phosphoribosylformimino-5-aminoimidazole carboxamide ribotide isomerase [Neoconidiobolus thromboides FSU 785]
MSTSSYSKFRPCIDLHEGKVKQIIGGTLKEDSQELRTNFVADKPSSYFASIYKQENLLGTHLIKLGNGNDEAALEALNEWSNHIQIGGGITIDNASYWLEKGASKVIVTSWLFQNGELSYKRLKSLCDKIGKDKLVVDLSCRKVRDSWFVCINKWQTITNLEINQVNLQKLEDYCSEFLIHAADVEGLCQGVDIELIEMLAKWVTIPTTYAGGASSVKDLELVNKVSNGKIDLTFGSALDIFGGNKVLFKDCVAWNQSGRLP